MTLGQKFKEVIAKLRLEEIKKQQEQKEEDADNEEAVKLATERKK